MNRFSIFFILLVFIQIISPSAITDDDGDERIVITDTKINLFESKVENGTLEIVNKISQLRESIVVRIDELKQETEKYKKLLDIYKGMSKSAGFQNLEELVARNVWKGDGRTVVMGVVTKSFLPLALNFLCSLRTIPYPPKVILWAADYDSYQRLKDEWGVEVVLITKQLYNIEEYTHNTKIHYKFDPPTDVRISYFPEMDLPQNTLPFHRLKTIRAKILLDILTLGYNVLMVDVDQVWVHNPLQHIFEITKENDIIITKNGFGDSIDYSDSFVFIRSSAGSISFIQKYCLNQVSLFKTLSADPNDQDNIELFHQIFFAQLSIEVQEETLNAFVLPEISFTSSSNFFLLLKQANFLRTITLHANHVHSSLEKKQFFQSLGNWYIDSSPSFVCPLPHPPPMDDDNLAKDQLLKKGFSITIKVIAFNRITLYDCLEALRNAKYDGDKINLDIYIDYDRNNRMFPNPIVALADTFYWPHGEKRIHFRSSHVHIVNQWLESWYPSREDFNHHFNFVFENFEFAFFVEDDVTVSTFYYRWLKNAIQKYYIEVDEVDPNLFAITLQNAWLNIHSFPEEFKVENKNTPIKYQLPGTWGVLIEKDQWKGFRNWFEFNIIKAISTNATSMSPYITIPNENFITNDWAKFSSSKMFLPWLIRYMFDYNLYTLYPNLPSRSLVINTQKKGVYNKEELGPDSILLLYEEEISSDRLFNFPPLSDLPLYNLCGKVVPYIDNSNTPLCT